MVLRSAVHPTGYTDQLSPMKFSGKGSVLVAVKDQILHPKGWRMYPIRAGDTRLGHSSPPSKGGVSCSNSDESDSARISNAILGEGYTVIHPNPAHMDEVVGRSSAIFAAVLDGKARDKWAGPLKDANPKIRTVLLADEGVKAGSKVNVKDTEGLLRKLNSFSKQTV